MPSILFADGFLAGSLLSLLLPVALVVAVVVAFMFALRRLPGGSGGSLSHAPGPAGSLPDGGAAPTEPRGARTE